MKRIVILLMAIALLAACGQKKEEGTEATEEMQTAQKPAEQAPANQEEEFQMIPPEGLTEFEKGVQARILPSFDPDGNVTEKAVAPGEYFDIYIVAEFNKLYQMAAAEYKLHIPAGIVVMGTTENDSSVISMGSYERDFSIAWQKCLNGPRVTLVKYFCKVEDDFQGGEVHTAQGEDLSFVGFTMCDQTKSLIRAEVGKATLSAK